MSDYPASPFQRLENVLTVGQLNRLARQAVEGALPLAWVTGEVSNLARPASGHLYFVLKDAQAQVRCVMFRNRAQLLPFQLRDGARVEIRGLATLYEARGDFQLGVEAVRQTGLGALYEAFLRLREALAAQGMFAEARKRPLPHLPRVIGLITSPGAAALHDVLVALRRRAPGIPVILYPTAVQGDAAGAQIATAVRTAGERAECDVLIVCRGGGSIEDLWAFNDEQLARALAESPIPVVCGVGHETDVTIADLASDVRAATPTAAAELATAGYVALAERLVGIHLTLRRNMQGFLQQRMQQVDQAARRIVHPERQIALAGVRMLQMHNTLTRVVRLRVEQSGVRLESLTARLHSRRPNASAGAGVTSQLARRLHMAAGSTLLGHQARLDALASGLALLNPQGVLTRGYSIVRKADQTLIADAALLQAGDALDITFAHGAAGATVTRIA